MKKVIFDVDGVLLSEERYFDVSALTVWELLYSKDYMGLPMEGEDFDARHVTEGQIASCRSRVWGKDRLLAFLKAHGINSNWDMVHCWLITALWLMALTYEKRSGGEKVCLTLEKPSDMKEAGFALMGLPVPEAEEILAKWEAVIPSDLEGENVVTCLQKAMAGDFGNGADWALLRSPFWTIHTEAFQVAHLKVAGEPFVCRLCGKSPVVQFKNKVFCALQSLEASAQSVLYEHLFGSKSCEELVGIFGSALCHEKLAGGDIEKGDAHGLGSEIDGC